MTTRSSHDLAGGSSPLLNAFSCILSVMEGGTFDTLSSQPGDGEQDPDGCEPVGHEPDGREPDGREPDGRELGAMTYWRRRFIALTVGLGILSLIAWAFSGTMGASQAGGSTAAGGARASHGHSASAAAGSGGSGGASRSATQPRATASATASPTAQLSAV